RWEGAGRTEPSPSRQDAHLAGGQRVVDLDGHGEDGDEVLVGGLGLQRVPVTGVDDDRLRHLLARLQMGLDERLDLNRVHLAPLERKRTGRKTRSENAQATATRHGSGNVAATPKNASVPARHAQRSARFPSMASAMRRVE